MKSRGSVLWRHLATVALVAGLLAVGTVDGLVVSDRRADDRREAAHARLVHDQADYAARLRAVAARVYDDVLPVQHVLDTLLSPRAGDVYAARDALANPTAVKALRADLHQLARLTPPAAYHPFHVRLHNALHAMWSTTTAMRKRQQIKNPVTLNSYLVDTDNAALIGAELDWRDALRDLYRSRHQQPPRAPQTGSTQHPPVSLVGWVFEADRHCLAAGVRSVPLHKRLDSNALDTGAIRAGAVLARRLVDQLRALPLPRESRGELRRTVLLRLQSLRAEGNALTVVANAIDRRDLTALDLAMDRMRTLDAALPALGRAFQRYHALACANFIGTGKADNQGRHLEV